MRGTGEHCPDDLLARSRKGPLSPVERRALDAHLGICGLCRAAVALGALHDAVPDFPFEDDAAVVARLAGRVVSRGGRRAPRAARVALAAGLTLTLVAGAAAAWKATHPAAMPPTAVPGLARSAPADAPPARQANVPPPELRPAPATKTVAASRPAFVSRRRRVAEVETTPAGTTPPERADLLFARANAARGAGDLRAAADGYALLQAQFPGSPEATVSLVSAGDLLARQGDPASALEQFDRYLAVDARAPLAPEALFGRARCLRALGRSRDEADTWGTLLKRFPGSLYEGAARRRLQELDAGGPAP